MQNIFTHRLHELKHFVIGHSPFNAGSYFKNNRTTESHHFNTECYNYYNAQSSVPKLYIRENENIEFENDLTFEKGCEIVKYIKSGDRKMKGPGYASSEILKAMKDNRGTISKDFSTLFINFCILNNIKVREWNVTENLNSSLNHVFNEIYCSEYDKWILIDVMEGFYFIDNYKKFPLSAVEYIDLLSAKHLNKIRTVSVLSGKEDDALRREPHIQKMYFNPSNLFCLLVNYKVNSVGVMEMFHKLLPSPWFHFLLLISGLSYNYVFYVNTNNEYRVRQELNKVNQPENGFSYTEERYTNRSHSSSYSFN